MDLTSSRHGIDCRVERLPTRPYELPGEVSAKIMSLVRRMELTFAAIDMRLTERGDIVFFEINPEGQYLWIEIDSGLPISAALARRLCYAAIGAGSHVQPLGRAQTTRPANATLGFDLNRAFR